MDSCRENRKMCCGERVKESEFEIVRKIECVVVADEEKEN